MKNLDSKKLVSDLSFVVLDLETTGGNLETDKIIEIGIVKIQNLEIIDELSYLINPEIPIPQFIQKLTSISPGDITNSPKIEDVIEEILEFIGPDIIVAHNISFDFPFLNSVLQRLNKPQLENRSLCTNLMTKYMIPNILSSNLNYMSQIFNIPHNKAHRALEDAKACAHLLLKYLNVFIDKGIRKVNQLYYPRSKFELDRSHFTHEEYDKIISTVEKIQSPAIISIKGFNGLQLATIPLISPYAEKEIVRTVLKELHYQSVTVQLMGSFFETFMTFNAHFNKFEQNIKDILVKYLCKKHLNVDEVPFSVDDFVAGLDQEHFLITKHLIPSQMLVFPLFNIHNKNELIFRFPSHKKRVLHYVLGHIKRSEAKKKKTSRHPIHKDLFPFINEYLKKVKEGKNREYLFISKEVILSDKNNFHNLLSSFNTLATQKTTYPREHI